MTKHLPLLIIFLVSCTSTDIETWSVGDPIDPEIVIENVVLEPGWDFVSMAWSPQSDRLCWLTTREGRSRLYFLSVPESVKHHVDYNSHYNSLDYKSQMLMLSSFDVETVTGEIRLLEGDTGATVNIFSSEDLGGIPVSPALSPDGSQLAYVLHESDYLLSSLVLRDTAEPYSTQKLVKGDIQLPQWFTNTDNEAGLVYFITRSGNLMQRLLSIRLKHELRYLYLDTPHLQTTIDSTAFHTHDYWAPVNQTSQIFYRIYDNEDGKRGSGTAFEYLLEHDRRIPLQDFDETFGPDHRVHYLTVGSQPPVTLFEIVRTKTSEEPRLWIATPRNRYLYPVQLQNQPQIVVPSGDGRFLAILANQLEGVDSIVVIRNPNLPEN